MSIYHLYGCGSGIELQVPISELCIYCNYRARVVRPYSVVVLVLSCVTEGSGSIPDMCTVLLVYGAAFNSA